MKKEKKEPIQKGGFSTSKAEINYDGWKVIEDNINNSRQIATEISGSIKIEDKNTNINDLHLYVKLTDMAGNETEEKVVFSIDKTNPKIEVTYDDRNTSPLVTDFYNKERRATIKITERNFDEARVEYELINNTFNKEAPKLSGWEETKNSENPDENTYVANIEYVDEGDYMFGITFTDRAGNVLEEEYMKDSKDKFTIDKQAPSIDVTYPTAVYTAPDTKKAWYAGDVAFSVDLSDNLAGFNEFTVDMNETIDVDTSGKSISESNKNYKAEDSYTNRTLTDSYQFNTNQAKIADDGSFKIRLDLADKSSNTKTYETTVYKDVDAPHITKYTFNAKGYQDGEGLPVGTADYGFYFVEDTVVTITADDTKTEDGKEVPSSGVESISYYTVDYTGKVTQQGTENVNDKNQIQIKIPADFKGQIFAKAKDHVKNEAKDYVKPEGAILETPGKHQSSSAITLSKAGASHKDASGLDLYNSNVPVNVVVQDTYSGIRTIEWSVTSPYDTGSNQSGSVIVDNKGNMSSGGWNREKTEVNLVTQMSTTINVGNNSNNIVVWVKLTDRAGNTSEQRINFSIDKTAPTINITYDHSNKDPGFSDTEYYKDTRTAIVTIKERNFNANDVVLRLTNTLGTTPGFSGWSTVVDSTNPDNTSHTARIVFSSDGDYVFTVDFTDMAGNRAATSLQQRFTMDQTKPIISVSFDNNEAKNTNYYKADRTATVTITERNFETSRIAVSMSAANQDKTVDVPTVNGWSTGSDGHVATIKFDKDALYKLKISYTDKAGNNADDFQEISFYVDKTIPELSVQGVTQKSANNGIKEDSDNTNIGFTIEGTDTNFDTITPELNLVGLEETTNQTELLGEGTAIENGRRYQVSNLESDGIYVVKCKAEDKAGNVQEKVKVLDKDGKEVDAEELMFSVNRNGSTYMLTDDTKKLNGTYTQDEQNVGIIEINVDEIHNTKLTMFHDTNTTVLKEGTDYKVKESGEEGQWHEYDYTVDKNNFKEDGDYSVSLYSVDAAENESENTMDTKNVEVRFAIDKTAPNVIVTDLESDETYSQDKKDVTMVVNDNMKLVDLKVYHSEYSKDPESADYGKVYKSWDQAAIEKMIADKGDYDFDIDGGSTKKHKVKIVATDAAGCETVVELKNFYVTTNWWINFYTNKPLFYGSIVALVLLFGGAATIIILIKKKKEDKSTKE